MAEWSSSKQALEIRGANHIRVLEITVTDPDGYGPNSGWYTTTKTLRLVDNTQMERTSAVGVDKDYWPAVLEWGDIYQGQDFGAAFSTVSDAQYVLRNAKITPQQDATSIKAGTEPNPEPTGDMIRLSDLMRYYEWTGATVTDKIVSYEDASINQNSADYRETTLFSGIVSNATVDADRLILDVVESEKERRSPVGQTFITDPQDRSGLGEMIPVVMGSFDHEATGSWNAYDFHKTLSGGRPSLLKASQWRLGDSGITGENATDTRYAWMDATGPNTGWTTQPDWGTTSDAPEDYESLILRHIPEADCYSQVIIGTSDGQVEWADNPTGAGTGYNDILYFRANKYLTGYAFIPCEAFVESTGTAPTNPENACNRDFSNYMSFDLTSTSNACTFRIPEIPPQGTIPISADSISAWVVYSCPTVDLGDLARLDIGFWRDTLGGGANATGSTSGQITLGAIALDPVLGVQVELTSGTTTSAFIAEAYREQWLWKETSASVRYPLYVHLKCGATSATVTSVRIHAVGIKVQHDMVRGSLRTITANFVKQTQAEQAAAIIRAGGQVVGGGPGFWTIRWKVDNREPSSANLYVTAAQTALDDASGTISGSAESSLTSPAHQAALVLLRYADGVTSSNLSFSTSTGTDGFGSVRRAKTLLDDWAQNIDGGGSETFDTAVRINSISNVGGAIGAISNMTPLMVYRTASGSYNFCVYPSARDTLPTQVQYVDSESNTVTFHPNTHHADGTRYGRPYDFIDLRAYLTPVEEVYNSWRIEYNPHPPTGSYSFYVTANADGYRVWDQTSKSFETSSNTLGGNIQTACSASETRLGFRREHPPVRLDNVNDNVTATAILDYLSQRFGKRRVIVEVTAFLEAYDLVPGHVVQLDNDTNLVMPVPAYGKEDWEDLYFIVLEVRYIPDPGGVKVWFRAEQLARV